MKEQLAEINRNSFLLILWLLTGVIIAALVSYLALPNYKSFSSTKHSYQTLKSALRNDGQLQDELQLAEMQINMLQKNLNGEGVNLPFKQFEAHVIGQLQQVAWRNNLELAGVRPKMGKMVDRFREILFDVDLSGDYFDIYSLLSDFEKTLGFVVINDFHIKPDATDRQEPWLKVQLTLASYRIENL